MAWYLTNTDLSNESLCLAAAQESGFDVRFEREPMPANHSDWPDEDDEIYARVRHTLIGSCGCVVSYDPRPDLSPFWRAWDRLEATSPASTTLPVEGNRTPSGTPECESVDHLGVVVGGKDHA